MDFNKTLPSHGDAERAESLVPERVVIQICKGVPTPTGRRSKYPFRDMEIGDSFFSPGSSVIGIHGCARRHRPKRFTCRSVDEDGVAGIRVWRIA